MPIYNFIELEDEYSMKIMDQSDDIDVVFDLVKTMVDDTSYAKLGLAYDGLRDLIQNITMFLLYHKRVPVGFLGAVFTPHLMFPQVLVGAEIGWFVLSDHRGKHSKELLKFFEAYSRHLGCSFTTVSNMGASALDRVYKSEGYKPDGHTFVKDIR